MLVEGGGKVRFLQHCHPQHFAPALVDDPEPASTQGPLIVLSGLKEEEEKEEEEKEMKLGRTCERSWRGDWIQPKII